MGLSDALRGIGTPEPQSTKLNLEIPTPARRKHDELKKRKREGKSKPRNPEEKQKRLDVRAVARRLVESKKYQKNLKARLNDGTLAAPMEALIWRYAYGDPVKDAGERERELARYHAMRKRLAAFMMAVDPAKLAAIDAAVQGSTKVHMPRPQLPAGERPDELLDDTLIEAELVGEQRARE